MFWNLWHCVTAAWRLTEEVAGWTYLLSVCFGVAVWIIGSLHTGRMLTDDDLIWMIFRVR